MGFFHKDGEVHEKKKRFRTKFKKLLGIDTEGLGLPHFSTKKISEHAEYSSHSESGSESDSESDPEGTSRRKDLISRSKALPAPRSSVPSFTHHHEPHTSASASHKYSASAIEKSQLSTPDRTAIRNSVSHVLELVSNSPALNSSSTVSRDATTSSTSSKKTTHISSTSNAISLHNKDSDASIKLPETGKSISTHPTSLNTTSPLLTTIPEPPVVKSTSKPAVPEPPLPKPSSLLPASEPPPSEVPDLFPDKLYFKQPPVSRRVTPKKHILASTNPDPLVTANTVGTNLTSVSKAMDIDLNSKVSEDKSSFSRPVSIKQNDLNETGESLEKVLEKSINNSPEGLPEISPEVLPEKPPESLPEISPEVLPETLPEKLLQKSFEKNTKEIKHTVSSGPVNSIASPSPPSLSPSLPLPLPLPLPPLPTSSDTQSASSKFESRTLSTREDAESGSLSLREEELRSLLLDHVAQDWCIAEAPAEVWEFQSIRKSTVYIATYEVCVEKRALQKVTEPYDGGLVDDYRFGRAQRLWDLDIPEPIPDFVETELKFNRPHSDNLLTCSVCIGVGQIDCNICQRLYQGNSSHPKLNESCEFCGDNKFEICKNCNGRGQTITKEVTHVTRSNIIIREIFNEFGKDALPEKVILSLKASDVFVDLRTGSVHASTNPNLAHLAEKLLSKRKKLNLNDMRVVAERYFFKSLPVEHAVMGKDDRSFDFFSIGMEKQIYVKDYPYQSFGFCLDWLQACNLLDGFTQVLKKLGVNI